MNCTFMAYPAKVERRPWPGNPAANAASSASERPRHAVECGTVKNVGRFANPPSVEAPLSRRAEPYVKGKEEERSSIMGHERHSGNVGSKSVHHPIADTTRRTATGRNCEATTLSWCPHPLASHRLISESLVCAKIESAPIFSRFRVK